MIIILGVVFFIFIFSVLRIVRSVRGVSADYRQAQYHHLSDQEIEQTVAQPMECIFYDGPVTRANMGTNSRITITAKAVVFGSGNKRTSIKIADIKDVKSPSPAILEIFPKDGDRKSAYFGDIASQRLYKDLPYKWQSNARVMRQNDKLAVAYYLKIKSLIKP